MISKLEKDKREVALARDKALKQIEDIDKVRVAIYVIMIQGNHLDLFTRCS